MYPKKKAATDITMKGRVSLATVGIFLLTISKGSHATEYFESLCGRVLDIGESGGVMDSGTDWFDTYYGNNADCWVTLQTSSDRQILLTWVAFNVESDAFIGSCVDSLQIHDGANLDSLTVINSNKQCGLYSDYPQTISTGNSLTLHLQTDATGFFNDFQFAYTSFSTGPCDNDEFKCDNGRCIDELLADILDFYDNCGDGSDFKALGDAVSYWLRWGLGVFIAIIVAIVICGILICVCCGCLCYHLCCKKQNSASSSATVIHGNPPPPPTQNGMPMHPTHSYRA